MSEFSELIKNFNKVRDYMRDFYIYGFKTRSDFKSKSLRTYDNEKRRIECWLGELVKFDNLKKGKQISISLDSGEIVQNPLYQAFRSKSFTDNDIRLHFFLSDLLKDGKYLSLDEITDELSIRYGQFFESQTVRIKLKEYMAEGIILAKKQGKMYLYTLSPDFPETLCSNMSALTDAIAFFSEYSPFGVIGSYLLDLMNKKNDLFLMKHNFIVYTLDDNILLTATDSISQKRTVEIVNFGKRHMEQTIRGIPLKIYISTQTGRRYLIMYVPSARRFASFRLDYIKSIKQLDNAVKFDFYAEKLEQNAQKCWGVTFGSSRKRKPDNDIFKMTIYANEENEMFIVNRLLREGRGGTVKRVAANTFEYSANIFNVREMSPWIKSFIGRIINIECNNQDYIDYFRNDIKTLYEMYNKSEV